MKLEAIGKGFTYRWPGGEIRLEPGRPVELPPERAAKLLARCKGRVRLIQQQPPDWLYEWRYLAAMTSGLTQDDPRLQPVLAALGVCDIAFLSGDYPGFMLAAAQVQEAMAR